MLRVRTLKPDDLSLPAYIPYNLRRVFIADEYGEQGMYHLSPPISKPDFLRDFQVRAQWQGHSVVIFPKHDGEQGDDFVTMGSEELEVDALGRDDDLGQDRHWEAPIKHFPRIPGDITWQQWVYREYQHAHFTTHKEFVQALYHLHSRHGYFDWDSWYRPKSVDHEAPFDTIAQDDKDKRNPNVEIKMKWCSCIKDWTDIQTYQYEHWSSATLWFLPSMHPSSPVASPLQSTPPSPTVKAPKPRRGTIADTVRLPLFINYRPPINPPAPAFPLQQIVSPTTTEEPYAFDDIKTSNITDEPVEVHPSHQDPYQVQRKPRRPLPVHQGYRPAPLSRSPAPTPPRASYLQLPPPQRPIPSLSYLHPLYVTSIPLRILRFMPFPPPRCFPLFSLLSLLLPLFASPSLLFSLFSLFSPLLFSLSIKILHTLGETPS
ncbi:hypothetical protein QCA50_001340 [Cerrena zonata]|uniref:Uncharacterized protein n=1 Tax=Cerrena zonata TaxID=2478898 RepID=A0AAW0GT04_9APHY